MLLMIFLSPLVQGVEVTDENRGELVQGRHS